MDFAQVLTKQFLLSHEGRINRQPYWTYVVVVIAASIVVGIVAGILHLQILSSLFGLVLIYPGVIVQIKRWHDRDKSGWWCLINLIPVIGWIWSIVECGFLTGTSGANRFGADPLGAKPAA